MSALGAAPERHRAGGARTGGQRPAWEWRATGTRWRIYHGAPLDADVVVAVRAAVARDERRWSRFLPDSELSQINRRAGRLTAVSAETFALLDACCAWQERTGGVFQPLIGAALSAWGYGASFGSPCPRPTRTPGPRPVTGSLVLDRERRAVLIPRGRSLDLGGIGKSWIATRAAAVLSGACSAPELLLDAGGDLLAVRGDHVVATADPAGHLHLSAGEGIATSGPTVRRWRTRDGRPAHHLIDPATGSPGPPVQATVLAADVVSADVLAKFLALRPHAIAAMAAPAMLITADAVIANAAWRRRASGGGPRAAA